ncbi:MAG TPA: hypothetical protein VFT06_03490, partial [Flavisolibacter sp.]|nr:hypothetical protein [Flavisolibacter sp.]
TTLLISTDHGRGRNGKWTTHHPLVRGSGEIWLAVLGQNILPAGEMQHSKTVYQNQVAATVASLIGEVFQSQRRIGKPVALQTMKTPVAASETTRQSLATPTTSFNTTNE